MEKWIKNGVKRAREGAMLIAGAQRMSHDEALKYADECEKSYLKGAKRVMFVAGSEML